ncbi:MAG: hypothetical protein ACK5H2_13560 [Beutenbergiaceae bacterium]
MSDAHPELSSAAALAHHLLLLPDGVTAADVAALAASWHPDQGADGPPRTVAGLPQTWITGPWGKSADVPLPDWVASIFVVQAPVERADPVPPELRGRGDLLDAFADGEPVGAERQAIDFTLAAARRLGGGMRASGANGLLLTPPGLPDLVLFSEAWLPQQGLLDLLSAQLPGLSATVPQASVPATGVTDPVSLIADEGERRWLHAEADAYDAAAIAGAGNTAEAESGAGVVVDGQDPQAYGVQAALPDGAVISIAVEPAAVLPPVLGGYAWESPVIYELRCYPAGDQPPPHARTLIDTLTATLLQALGGRVVDDDGFLV